MVVDDEPNVRDQLGRQLRRQGLEVALAENGRRALEEIARNRPDVVLCDVRMPELDGLGFLDQLGGRDTEIPVVIMSAYGDIELAREALAHGACDYLSKPIRQEEELILRLHIAFERMRLKTECSRLREKLQQEVRYQNIVGESEPIKQLLKTIARVAEYKSTVLIQGEGGTGKELVARAIHNLSSRRDKPFVAVNCGAIPENLLESELFGYVRGAFTDAYRNKSGLFEEADGGTLFLDEIGELPLGLQVKLLRVLQEEEIRRVGENQPRKVDVRVLAATIRDLGNEVRAGRFREDLFYRLNVLTVRVPPLRERQEDIPLLVEHFLKRCNQKLGTSVKSVDPAAMRMLVEYQWPGNVRELENLIERAVVLCDGDTIGPDLLTDKVAQTSPRRPALVPPGELSIKKVMRAVEEELIRKALEQTDGNQTQAARILEISTRTLIYKMKYYKIKGSD